MNSVPLVQVATAVPKEPSEFQGGVASDQTGQVRPNTQEPTFAGALQIAATRQAHSSNAFAQANVRQGGSGAPAGGKHLPSQSPAEPSAAAPHPVAASSVVPPPMAQAATAPLACAPTSTAPAPGAPQADSPTAGAPGIAAINAAAGTSDDAEDAASTLANSRESGNAAPDTGATAAQAGSTSADSASASASTIGNRTAADSAAAAIAASTSPGNESVYENNVAVTQADGGSMRQLSKGAVRESALNAGSLTSNATASAAGSAPTLSPTERASAAAFAVLAEGAAAAASVDSGAVAPAPAMLNDSIGAATAPSSAMTGMGGMPGTGTASGAAGATPSSALAGSAAAASVAAVPAMTNADNRPQPGVDPASPSTLGAAAVTGPAQLGSTAQAAAPAASPVPTLRINAAVESAEFAQNLSDRVSWMMSNGVNSAKLQVNPPQLGPIELSIQVQGDHAQVSMSAHSAVTRDALQSSSPQLREMLGAQGFGQVSVDISQRSFQDRAAHAPPYERAPPSDDIFTAAPGPVAAPPPRASAGALDAYA